VPKSSIDRIRLACGSEPTENWIRKRWWPKSSCWKRILSFLRAADEARAPERAGGVEARPLEWRPAALAADAVHHLCERRERLVGGLLRGLGHEPVRVDAQGGRLVTRLDRRAAMELCKRHEPLGHPADDRERRR